MKIVLLILALLVCSVGWAVPPTPPQVFELACPAGYNPLSTLGKTFDSITGKWRANFCVSTSGNGRMVCQMDGCGAVPTTTLDFPSITGGTNTVPAAHKEGSGSSMSAVGLGQVAATQLWVGGSATVDAPVLTGSQIGGTLGNIQYYVVVTLNTAAGESLPSAETGIQPSPCTLTHCSIVVTPPVLYCGALPCGGYTGYTVYSVASSPGSEKRQNASAACVNITAACTISSVGLGAVPPTVNTAYLQPPFPVIEHNCPPGQTVFEWLRDVNGNGHELRSFDPFTDNAGYGPPDPGGTELFCHRTWFNDTKIVPTAGKNGLLAVDHMLGTGSVLANQDRAIYVHERQPPNDTANRYGIEVFQSEFTLTGTPSFMGFPDSDITTGVFSVEDAHVGLIGMPASGFNGIRISSVRTSNGTWAGCGLACIRGMTVNAINMHASDMNNGTAGIVINHGAADPSYGSTGLVVATGDPVSSGGGARGIWVYGQGTKPGMSFDLATWPNSLVGSPITFPGGEGETYHSGSVYLANIGTSQQTIHVAGSFLNKGSLGTVQLDTPTTIAVIPQGTPGGTSWGYKMCARDGNGDCTIAGAQAVINTGSATLSVSNFNRVCPDPSSPQLNVVVGVDKGVSGYDVYRTAANGTPNTTGKIGTIVPIQQYSQFSSGNAAVNCLDDTGLAADGSTPPAINTTGGLYSATGVKSAAAAFANLPACGASTEGTIRAVTDSASATWGATVTGSSTNHVLAYCNGTNWTVAAK